MAKIKKLSTEIISSLFLESLSFNQLIREIEEDKKDIGEVLDMLLDEGIVIQTGSLYSVTEKAKDLFSCWYD